MIKYLFFVLIFLTKFVTAQNNLVLNPSFEEYTNCPTSFSVFNTLINWTNPTNASPDYFNSCANGDGSVPLNIMGYQNPINGSGYVGIGFFSGSLANYREYIQGKLTVPLEINKKYFISFYLSKSDNYNYAVNNVGVYFSDNSFYINTSENLYILPQFTYISPNPISMTDTSKWIEIIGLYEAIGGEEYITIGNFHNDNETDTIFTSGQFNGSYYYIDDVSVILDTTVGANEVLRVKSEEYKIYPNPSSTSLFIDLFNFNADIVAFELYDIIGKQIIKNTLLELNNKLNITEIPQGVYYYKLLINKEIFSEKIVVIH